MPGRLASRVLVTLALIAVCLIAAAATAQTPTPAPAAKSDCDQPTAQPYSGAKVKANANDQPLKLTVGRHRSGEVSDEVQIGMRDPLPAKGISLVGEPQGSLLPEEGEGSGSGRIRPSQIKVGVTQSAGTTIIVNACIIPKSVKPGRYTGKVLVRGDEIEPFTIVTTATVQASGYVGWAILALLAGALGFFLRTVANLAQLAEKPPKQIAQKAKREKREVHIRDVWPAYRRDLVIFISSIILTVIAVGGAYVAAYWTNETFGADTLVDYLALAGAAFVAATGGTTVADLFAAFKYRTE
jgi:hypothetical protein